MRNITLIAIILIATDFLTLDYVTCSAASLPNPTSPSASVELQNRDWSIGAPRSLILTPPTTREVVSYLNGVIKDQGVDFDDDDDVCSFGFFDLRGTGKYTLVVSQALGRHECNNIVIADADGAVREFPVWLTDDVKSIIRPARGEKRPVLVMHQAWHPTSGLAWCTATWIKIYRLNAHSAQDVSFLHPEIYRSQLRDLAADIAATKQKVAHHMIATRDGEDARLPTSCDVMESDRIKRFLKIDPNAGYATAEAWLKSSDHLLAGNAIAVLRDIASPKAMQELQALTRSPDATLRTRAADALLGQY